MDTLQPADGNVLPSIETADPEAHSTSAAAGIGEEDDDDLEAALWKAFEDEDSAEAALDADVRHDNNFGSPEVSDEDDGGASLNWGSPEPSSSSQPNETLAALASEVHDEDDGGAPLGWGSPEPPLDTDSLNSPSKDAAQASSSVLSSPAASSDKSMTINSKQKSQTKKSPVQISDTNTNSTVQSAKPKRQDKPRAKKADQAPAPDLDLTEPTAEELLAELEAELGPDFFDGGASLSNDSNTSPTVATPAASIAENESSSSPSNADGQRSTKPRTKIGKDSKAKRKEEKIAKREAEKQAKREEKAQQDKERQEWSEKNRQEIIHRRIVTPLDRAVDFIHAKSPKKAREIFIETKLSDTVLRGQEEADGVIAEDDVSVLPKLYHEYWKDGPNYRILAKHMELDSDIKLNDVYISLGLNIDRGRDIYDTIKKLLRYPGCSLRMDGESIEDHKILVGERAHDLLAGAGWGLEYFQRPDLTAKDSRSTLFGKACWSGASTDIFLGFSKLLYNAAKKDEARRKGLSKQTHVEPATVAPVEQHPSLSAPAVPVSIAPPMATATDPTVTHSPYHAMPTPAKRARTVIDLTRHSGGEVDASPIKRPRLNAQQVQQNRNVQLPLQQHTLHPAALAQPNHTGQHSYGQFLQNQHAQHSQVPSQGLNPYHVRPQSYQDYGYQVHPNVQAVPQYPSPQRPEFMPQGPNMHNVGPPNYQSHGLQGHQNTQAVPEDPSLQCTQVMPQRLNPYNVRPQDHQDYGYQAFHNFQTVPQDPSLQHPQTVSQYTTPPRPQNVRQYHTPPVPQAVPQYHTAPRPQTMPQCQAPQRPWAHLQSQHNSPQDLQLQQGQNLAVWPQQNQQQSPTPQSQAQPNQVPFDTTQQAEQLWALHQAQAGGHQLQMQERPQAHQVHSQYLMRPQHPQVVQSQAQQMDVFWC
ncbi:hypothetical protein N0V82_010670 [Gnomoniopsis sp. IMI 355080]|nr:hypothetical protein N0V82_010670 [Gnomoniopsis sp. IMI 355080]